MLYEVVTISGRKEIFSCLQAPSSNLDCILLLTPSPRPTWKWKMLHFFPFHLSDLSIICCPCPKTTQPPECDACGPMCLNFTHFEAGIDVYPYQAACRHLYCLRYIAISVSCLNLCAQPGLARRSHGTAGWRGAFSRFTGLSQRPWRTRDLQTRNKTRQCHSRPPQRASRNVTPRRDLGNPSGWLGSTGCTAAPDLLCYRRRAVSLLRLLRNCLTLP